MKTKLCLFALCLASGFLPAMALDTDMDQMDRNGGVGPAVKPKSITIPLLQIEVESKTINILFTRDLGIVNLQLQDATGFIAVDEQVDTSVQNQVSFDLSASSYTLTATTADEVIITQVSIVIP